MKHTFNNFKESIAIIAQLLENKQACKHYKSANTKEWTIEECKK